MYQNIFFSQLQFKSHPKQSDPSMLTMFLLLSAVICVQILSFTSFVVGNKSLTHASTESTLVLFVIRCVPQSLSTGTTSGVGTRSGPNWNL